MARKSNPAREGKMDKKSGTKSLRKPVRAAKKEVRKSQKKSDAEPTKTPKQKAVPKVNYVVFEVKGPEGLTLRKRSAEGSTIDSALFGKSKKASVGWILINWSGTRERSEHWKDILEKGQLIGPDFSEFKIVAAKIVPNTTIVEKQFKEDRTYRKECWAKSEQRQIVMREKAEAAKAEAVEKAEKATQKASKKSKKGAEASA